MMNNFDEPEHKWDFKSRRKEYTDEFKQWMGNYDFDEDI